MIVSELFNQINGSYRGTDDSVPTADPDLQYWYDTTNRKITEWLNDPVNIEPGTVATDGTTLTGTNTQFTLYAPDGIITVNGETPRIIGSITSDTELEVTVDFTNTVSAESFKHQPEVTEMTDLADTIPVEDPYWLVYAVASELAFNDLTYEDKAPALNAKANSLYRMMVRNKRRTTTVGPRTIPTNVYRIGS